ncbi:hypothetical protein [Mycobacterium sp. 1423905.2]|uniref:hypothetical protein n=1 Tax=Mycobacterium sp. 1423905.2 TaxID=1856859 RepID=UPI0012EA326E|nr:hypothetical protein [Mycobacterium sp. 1423905.2]
MAELESQLAVASRRHGRTVAFTPSEAAVVGMVCDEIDRKAGLKRLYGRAETVKEKLKISTEIRLLEASIDRMLRRVKVDMPAEAAPSVRTRKARHAANVRWRTES